MLAVAPRWGHNLGRRRGRRARWGQAVRWGQSWGRTVRSGRTGPPAETERE